MARFLFCLPRFHTNAGPWMRILQAAGHETSVWVLRTGKTEDHRRAMPRVVPVAPWSREAARLLPGKADPQFYETPDLRTCLRLLREEQPDVVIVRGLSRWFCRMTALAALLQRRRLVIYDQDDPDPKGPSGTWLRRVAMNAIGVPHFTARVPGVPIRRAGRAETIPFGAPEDAAQLRKIAAERIERLNVMPRILMVAKYRSRKGHETLVAALGRLADEFDFTVTFCGEEADDADRDFRHKIEGELSRVGIADRARFLANLDRRDMDALYAEHDLFVLPSLNEPAAISPIEAVWHGCAALVDRASGTRWYLPPEEGYQFDASDPADLARALRPPLADAECLREMKKACLARLVSLADDQTIVAQFERLALPSQAAKSLL